MNARLHASSHNTSSLPHHAMPVRRCSRPALPLQMGVGADVALGGEPAGGLKPSTEAAVKKELQEMAAKKELPADKGVSVNLVSGLLMVRASIE